MPRSKRKPQRIPQLYSVDGQIVDHRNAMIALDSDALRDPVDPIQAALDWVDTYPNKKRIVMPRTPPLPLISSPNSQYFSGSDSALMRGLAAAASSVGTQYAPPAVRAGLNALNMLRRIVSARKVAGALRKKASRMSKKGNKRMDIDMNPAKRHRKWQSASTAYYKGTFRRPRRTKEPKVETKCLKYGYHLTNECHGDIEDHHTVYVGHNTYDPGMYSKAICGALLRKLLKKAGVQVDNQEQVLPLTFSRNASGHKIEFITYNQATGFPTVYTSHNTIVGETFESLVNSGMETMLIFVGEYLRNLQQDEPYQLNFYAADAGVGYTDWRLQASLQLTNEFVSIYASSSLKVQNRTAGDIAGGAQRMDSDRIDNQPLQGYSYQFKHADPRLKFPTSNPLATVNQFNSADVNGVILRRSVDVTANLQEPPVPKYWSNVTKSARIGIQPGELKKTYIQVKFKGRLTTLLKYLRATRSQVVTGPLGEQLIGIPGKAQILGFEEKIRTSGQNPITIVYEREMKVGCTTKTGPTAPLLTKYSSTVKNLVPT